MTCTTVRLCEAHALGATILSEEVDLPFYFLLRSSTMLASLADVAVHKALSQRSCMSITLGLIFKSVVYFSHAARVMERQSIATTTTV